MPKPEHQETYYEVLKVGTKASITEIVAAYHSAKSAFSKDSIATYSLFNQNETELVLNHLEEAYLTLSNLDKKRDYDRFLSNRLSHGEAAASMTMTTHKQTSESFQIPLNGVSEITVEKAFDGTVTDPNMLAPGKLSGTFLKEVREKRTLSIEDVSRITKIPSKFLKAIEENNKKTVPARVYLQGFVKNLASLYKMDPQETVKAYLDFLDKKDN